MRKLLLAVALLLIPSITFGAGTCVLDQSGTQSGGNRMWRQYLCTADASDGSMAAFTVGGFYDFYIYSIETWSGTTAPTDNTDFTLLEAVTGEDIVGGNGTDGIDATTSNTVLPRSSFMSLNFYHMIKGDLTLTITNNSVNSAEMYIRVTGVR